MADIEIRRLHELGLAGARAAAERMAEDLRRRFGLAGSWQGNVFRFERPGVKGSLAVSERDLHLDVALGLLLKAMRGSIERAVNEQLDAITRAPPAARPPKPPKAPKKAR